MMPVSYYLSSNWGVQEALVIDVSPYESVIPLLEARGFDTGFNAVVFDSWKNLDPEAKTRAVEQLAAMIAVEGYQTLFLTYETQGIAAIYNSQNKKIVVK